MSNIWVKCMKEKQRLQKELLKCPFCGGDPKITHAVLEEYYSVDPDIACEECGYYIKGKNLAINMDNSPKENCAFLDRQTIKTWNTRPAEDALKAEIERLKEALESICLVAAFPSPCPEYIEQVRGIAKEALDKMQIRTGRDG